MAELIGIIKKMLKKIPWVWTFLIQVKQWLFGSLLSLSEARAYLNAGNLLAQKEKFDEAIENYQKALTIKPDWADPYYHLGNALNSLGNKEEAIASYQIASNLNPMGAQIYLELGNLLAQQRDLDGAMNNCSKALILSPNWAEAYFYRGNIFNCLGQYELAIKDYERAIDLKLDWVDLYVNLSNSLIALIQSQTELKEIETMISKVRNAIALNPNRAELHLCLGKIFVSQEQYDQMIECYQKALEFEYEDSGIYLQIGNAFRSQGYLEEAETIYQKAINCDPDQAEAHFSLGNILLKQGSYQDALASHYQALTLKSNWSASNYFCLDYLCYQEHLEGMLLIYEQAFRLKSDWIEGYYEAGNWLMHSGHFDAALKYWQKCYTMQTQLAKELDIDTKDLQVFGVDFTRNIGHIALLDFHIKMDILGWSPPDKRRVIWAPSGHQIANRCLLNYWRTYLPVISNAFEHPEIPPLLNYVQEYITNVTLADGQTLYYSQAGAAVQKQWEAEKRPPLLTLYKTDAKRGWKWLNQLGVPSDAWFVCLHVREPGFYRQWNQPFIRDADITTYQLAIQSIVEQGGWVIRMGDSSMKPLPSGERVIDYAHSNVKSEWMDVFLWASCRFFIGTTSGPVQIPPLFGVPCVMTNWVIPFRGSRGWSNQDILIPKLYWSERENRYLSFDEQLSPPLNFAQTAELLSPLGVKVVDNTPEEINNAVLEMMERLEETIQYTEEDRQLQEQFNRIAETHHCYGSTWICRTFLHNYAYLLNPPQN